MTPTSNADAAATDFDFVNIRLLLFCDPNWAVAGGHSRRTVRRRGIRHEYLLPPQPIQAYVAIGIMVAQSM